MILISAPEKQRQADSLSSMKYDLYSEFQDSQDYIVSYCLKNFLQSHESIKQTK